MIAVSFRQWRDKGMQMFLASCSQMRCHYLGLVSDLLFSTGWLSGLRADVCWAVLFASGACWRLLRIWALVIPITQMPEKALDKSFTTQWSQNLGTEWRLEANTIKVFHFLDWDQGHAKAVLIWHWKMRSCFLHTLTTVERKVGLFTWKCCWSNNKTASCPLHWGFHVEFALLINLEGTFVAPALAC